MANIYKLLNPKQARIYNKLSSIFAINAIQYAKKIKKYNNNYQISLQTYNIALELIHKVVFFYSLNIELLHQLKHNADFFIFACISIASKFEEVSPFDIYSFVLDHQHIFESKSLFKMEINVLQIINYKCNTFTIVYHIYHIINNININNLCPYQQQSLDLQSHAFINSICTHEILTTIFATPNIISNFSSLEIAAALIIYRIISPIIKPIKPYRKYNKFDIANIIKPMLFIFNRLYISSRQTSCSSLVPPPFSPEGKPCRSRQASSYSFQTNNLLIDANASSQYQLSHINTQYIPIFNSNRITKIILVFLRPDASFS